MNTVICLTVLIFASQIAPVSDGNMLIINNVMKHILYIYIC